MVVCEWTNKAAGATSWFAIQVKTTHEKRVTGLFGYIPTPIDEQEIAAIQRVVKSGFGLSPHPFLQVGHRVRVESGSLNGLEGLITDVRRGNRLILSVSLLQRSVAVEIDSAWVK